MKRELVNVAKLGVKAVAGVTLIGYTNTLIKRNQVTTRNIAELAKKLNNFVVFNKDVLQTINDKIPTLLVDENVFTYDHVLYNILMRTDVYESERRCLYDSRDTRSNVCLFLANIIRTYGKDRAYKYACLEYIRGAICNSPNQYTIPYKYADDPKRYNKFVDSEVKRIYKQCIHR